MPEYRRRLPHFQPEDAYLLLTWRLWGSLPERVKLVPHRTQGQAFVAQDRALDRRCSGPLWLKQPRIAASVAGAIQNGEGERHFYELDAWGNRSGRTSHTTITREIRYNATESSPIS